LSADELHFAVPPIFGAAALLVYRHIEPARTEDKPVCCGLKMTQRESIAVIFVPSSWGARIAAAYASAILDALDDHPSG
jgi:hypothetical protein